jgi:hypothetical protein
VPLLEEEEEEQESAGAPDSNEEDDNFFTDEEPAAVRSTASAPSFGPAPRPMLSDLNGPWMNPISGFTSETGIIGNLSVDLNPRPPPVDE